MKKQDEYFEHKIDEMIKLIQFAKEQHGESIRLNNLLQNMIMTAGGFLWKKDAKGRYEYCDPTWCEVFFKMKHGCDIIGYNDQELLDDFRSDGRQHTYGVACKGTDQHCAKQKQKCHYIEMGWIEKELFIIDVIKTPIFINDILTGTVGFARDLSYDPAWICNEVSNALKNEEAEIVYKLNDDVAAYYITRHNHKNMVNTCFNHFPGARQKPIRY